MFKSALIFYFYIQRAPLYDQKYLDAWLRAFWTACSLAWAWWWSPSSWLWLGGDVWGCLLVQGKVDPYLYHLPQMTLFGFTIVSACHAHHPCVQYSFIYAHPHINILWFAPFLFEQHPVWVRIPRFCTRWQTRPVHRRWCGPNKKS